MKVWIVYRKFYEKASDLVARECVVGVFGKRKNAEYMQEQKDSNSSKYVSYYIREEQITTDLFYQ